MISALLGVGAFICMAFGLVFLRNFMLSLGTVIALASIGLSVYAHLVWGLVYLFFGGSFFLATVTAIIDFTKKNEICVEKDEEGYTEPDSEEDDLYTPPILEDKVQRHLVWNSSQSSSDS